MSSAIKAESDRQNRSRMAESINLRAHEKWQAGELRSAFRLMRSAANLGGYAAKSNLAYFYDVGIGVKKDRNRAMRLYRSALREGNSYWATNIGTIYRDENRTSLALRWFHKAVELGDIDAKLEVAKLLLNRLNDPKAAARHLKRVLKAKGGVDVTIDSQEQAAALLNKIERNRPPNTACPQKHRGIQ